jgi:hypothetical protein
MLLAFNPPTWSLQLAGDPPEAIANVGPFPRHALAVTAS